MTGTLKDFIKNVSSESQTLSFFWSLIFTLMLIGASYFISGINFVNQFGIPDMVKVFADTLLCRAPGSAVYWFFWMMLAMYIIMPVFNKWINDVDFTKLNIF